MQHLLRGHLPYAGSAAGTLTKCWSEASPRYRRHINLLLIVSTHLDILSSRLI